MRRRWVIYTLLSTLLCVVPRAWAATLPEPADHEPSEVATVWFDTLYDVVKSEAIAFPEAGRIYGVSAVALYEAVVPGAPHHRSLVGQLRDLAAVLQPNASEPYHWPTVANAALARTIRGVFPSLTPESLDAIDALEQKFAAQFQVEVPPEDEARSVVHGQAVADAILAWAATDGYPEKGEISNTNSCGKRVLRCLKLATSSNVDIGPTHIWQDARRARF